MKTTTRKIRPMTLAEFDAKFPDEDACKSYLAACRWPEGPSCPRCFNFEVYELNTRPYHWQCHKCQADGYRFSVLVGTIFENTNYPLLVWFKVMYLMLASKKGMSALQIQRMMGMGSYHTAHAMCHKIRAALGQEHFVKLAGFVEVDETYVGGKITNKHKGPGGRGGSKRGVSGKTPIIGAVSRKGNVIARVIDRANTETLNNFVDETISHKVSLISTDDNYGYRQLRTRFPHGIVRHSKDEYVIGAVHTNTIEGFWSMIKRGIVGTYHKVSKKYLQLYVNEFEFRYNNRSNGDMFATAIKAC